MGVATLDPETSDAGALIKRELTPVIFELRQKAPLSWKLTGLVPDSRAM